MKYITVQFFIKSLFKQTSRRVTYRIEIVYDMGSYKFYVAVVAIASIALQEASCGQGGSVYSDPKQYGESENMPKPVGELYNCDEYKSKIWDNAFSDLEAMRLIKLVAQTAKEMNTDNVCSDTMRVLLNFVNVMATSQNVHFTVGMFNKMVAFIIREVDTTSEKFKETKQVFERMVKNEQIRDLVRHSIVRTVELLKYPENRGRLFRVLKAFENLIKPSDEEELANQKLMGLANRTKNKVGSLLPSF